MTKRHAKKVIDRWLRTKEDLPHNRLHLVGVRPRVRRAMVAREQFFQLFKDRVGVGQENEFIDLVIAQSKVRGIEYVAKAAVPRMPYEDADHADRPTFVIPQDGYDIGFIVPRRTIPLDITIPDAEDLD